MAHATKAAHGGTLVTAAEEKTTASAITPPAPSVLNLYSRETQRLRRISRALGSKRLR